MKRQLKVGMVMILTSIDAVPTNLQVAAICVWAW